MLLSERIDLWAVMEFTAPYLVKGLGHDPNNSIEIAYCLEETQANGAYRAFSRSTPDAVVEKFKAALQRVKQLGVYDRIVAEHR